MRKQVAYSLLEVLVVLAIFALIASFSLPTFNYFSRSVYANLLKTQLWSAIQFAKQQSRIRCMPISLCHSKNSMDCNGDWLDSLLIFVDEKNLSYPKQKKDILLMFKPITHQGSLQWQSFPHKSYLVFSPGEHDEANNGTFWYCLPGEKYPLWAIAINRAHRERIIYPNKAGHIKNAKGEILACRAD